MSKNNFLNLFKKGKTRPKSQDKEAMDKKYVQELQNLIGKKLKDPSMAKKAAQIIEEMIQEKADTAYKKNKENYKKSA
jgi:hypothetical protein